MNICREKTGRGDASQHAATKKCLSGTPRARKTAGQQREDPRPLECHFALFRNRPQQDLRTKVMIAAGSYVVFQHECGRYPHRMTICGEGHQPFAKRRSNSG